MEYSPIYIYPKFYPNGGTYSIHGYLELFMFFFKSFGTLNEAQNLVSIESIHFGGVNHFDQTANLCLRRQKSVGSKKLVP